MEANITREQALALLREYNEEPFHIQHALTVEGVLRWYARELGCGRGILGPGGAAARHRFRALAGGALPQGPGAAGKGRLLAGADPCRLLPRVRHLLRRGARPRDGEGPLRGG